MHQIALQRSPDLLAGLREPTGPRILNSLPDYLKDSELFVKIFKRYLKTYFFARYQLLDALVH